MLTMTSIPDRWTRQALFKCSTDCSQNWTNFLVIYTRKRNEIQPTCFIELFVVAAIVAEFDEKV